MTTPTLTERAEQHYAQQLTARGVPEHLHEGLILYLTRGILPGSFLLAIVLNDLVATVGHADDDAMRGIKSLVQFLYYDTPGTAWGSPAKVEAWRETFRTGGAA